MNWLEYPTIKPFENHNQNIHCNMEVSRKLSHTLQYTIKDVTQTRLLWVKSELVNPTRKGSKVIIHKDIEILVHLLVLGIIANLNKTGLIISIHKAYIDVHLFLIQVESLFICIILLTNICYTKLWLPVETRKIMFGKALLVSFRTENITMNWV